MDLSRSSTTDLCSFGLRLDSSRLGGWSLVDASKRNRFPRSQLPLAGCLHALRAGRAPVEQQSISSFNKGYENVPHVPLVAAENGHSETGKESHLSHRGDGHHRSPHARRVLRHL